MESLPEELGVVPHLRHIDAWDLTQKDKPPKYLGVEMLLSVIFTISL